MTSIHASADQLVQAYRAGDLDPRTVCEEQLGQAVDSSERFAAISVLNADDARKAAAASATRWAAGAPLGPLDGVPMTFKDSFHVTGLTRTHGSAMHEPHVSTYDAAPVRRAREAGMVILGKTTMPDMALLISGRSSLHGTIRNPWDPRTNPGGSSSGAAVALASGAGAIAMGTDMAGSVRIPAALCGVTAIAPTQGRIAYNSSATYRTAGPMARTVADLETMLEVVGQFDAVDRYASAGAFVADRRPLDDLRGTTIGVLRRVGFGPAPDTVTAAAHAAQVELLGTLGAQVVEIDDFQAGDDDYAALHTFMRSRGIVEWQSAPPQRRGLLLPDVAEFLEPILRQSALVLALAMERLTITTHRLQQQFSRFDYVLTPSVALRSFGAEVTKPVPGLESTALMGFSCWFNQMGMPSGSVPVDRPDAGVPVSVQVVGRRHGDAGVLRLMRLLESCRGFEISYPGTPTAPLTTGSPHR
jgi:aspartyl-tRNA(Asn)/glutamyl-tRNA(Gln) amidotransferase subunit A